MDVTVPNELYHQQEQEQVLTSPPAPCKPSNITSDLDSLFSDPNMEVDFSLEWLSVFVEDCLSSTGNCIPEPAPAGNAAETMNTARNSPESLPKKHSFQVDDPSPLTKLVISGKARSKRKRVSGGKIRFRNPSTGWCYANGALNFSSSDSPLLQQTHVHWLADSELIIPIKEGRNNKDMDSCEAKVESRVKVLDDDEEEENIVVGNSTGSKDRLRILENKRGEQQQQQPRRCTHCLAQRTPQWRAGPVGPKMLCNACGVRYKSGRLLPEYRPAKSPTFVSYLHSNSHKKVMEMRMQASSTLLSSSINSK